MLELIGGYVTDLSLLAGIVLFIMSFLAKYKEHRFKLIAVAILLLIIGIAFFDVDAFIEGYERGREFAENL